nr:hypothetical protein [uncultured Prevotella sp.]
MQKVTKLLLVLLMLPLAFASAASNKKVSEKRMAAYLMVFHRDGEIYGWGNNRGLVLMKSSDLIHWTHTVVDITEKEAKRLLDYDF